MTNCQPVQEPPYQLISKQKINQYLSLLEKQGAAKTTLKRKEASLNKFADWIKKEYGQQEEALKNNWLKIEKTSPPPTVPKGQFKTPIFKYFSFLVIALLIGALSWGIYAQFIARPPEEPSLAALPTLPPNLISFQGRLTNTVGTPIHATVSASFKIYDVDEGGSALWSETKNITTNIDGIFNTMLGSSNPVDPSVFADNVNLWLGITIEGDDEMEPRQQIATVGYAYNSRYLQGYPASTSATAETVPVIDSNGYLILASSSPRVESISGTFGLMGEAITIQSTGGAGGGDILIQPDTDTEGQVIVYSGTTTDNSFTVQNANITTGTLIYAEAGTSGSNYNLLELASGSPLTTKFTVDYAGNTNIAGNLSIASGSDLYLGSVGLGSTGGAGLIGMNNNGFTYVSSSTVQGGLFDLDSAINTISASSGWVLNGDSGTPQIIGTGQTAVLIGGTGISTSVGATRQLTITNPAPWV
ncbi:MAG: hypothetical protein PHX72_02980, partial [Candidatus Shapirobacteria bacterium]|nr:hypothetical protein [Candidatus Shapirobacteria bacterium]